MRRLLSGRLRLPVIAAPMTRVSGPDLVLECCRNGVVGAFPTHNASTPTELDRWLTHFDNVLAEHPRAAPYAANLIVHRSNRRRDADVDCLLDHGVELVILSVGSPQDVIGRLKKGGARVLVDVASLRHVERARDAGADGVVLLTAGAGGQTGWLNPLAFVRAARAIYGGLIVLAGGMTDGHGIAAARVLGADLAYLGTRFIATHESLADDDYISALIAASIDDVFTTTRLTGLPANVLRQWAQRHLGEDAHRPAAGFDHGSLGRPGAVWAAGHSAGAVAGRERVADLIERVASEFHAAASMNLLGESGGSGLHAFAPAHRSGGA